MAGRGRGSASSVAAAVLCAAAAVLLVVASAPGADAAGTTYLVGDAAGWTRNVDYGQWLAGKTFHAGDILGTCSRSTSVPHGGRHVGLLFHFVGVFFH